jgi:hypothetical protein
MLVIGAGLMIRSFTRLVGVNAGFRSDHVLTTRMLLLPSKYGPWERRVAVIGRLCTTQGGKECHLVSLLAQSTTSKLMVFDTSR